MGSELGASEVGYLSFVNSPVRPGVADLRLQKEEVGEMSILRK